MRERKGYSLKRQRGLVPHFYDQGSRSYHMGADKNWPSRASQSERAKMAWAETPSNNGYQRGHTFVRETQA